MTNSLYHYYALMTGKAVQQEKAKVLYVDTTTRAGLGLLPELRRRRNYDFFCLNDGSFPKSAAPSGRSAWSISWSATSPSRAMGKGCRRYQSAGLGRTDGVSTIGGWLNSESRRDGSMNIPLSAICRFACAGETKVPTVLPVPIGITECTTVSGYTCTRLQACAASRPRVPRPQR